MPDLDALLARAKTKGVFGTKMRSVIKRADAKGIESVVAQQFTIAKQILAAGLMPIVEPEVSIKAPDKEVRSASSRRPSSSSSIRSEASSR
jgi:fructose-bisphosphate aldolase class I